MILVLGLQLLGRGSTIAVDAKHDRHEERTVGTEKMMDKVKALLAKAERTEFPEEAQTLTAKASELILRYSLDEAEILARTGKANEEVIKRNYTVKGYAKAKADMAAQVGNAMGIKVGMYRNGRAGWSEVTLLLVGWESDVDAYEVMMNSLIAQGEHEAKPALAKAKVEFDTKMAERKEFHRANSLEFVAVDWADEKPHGRSFTMSFLYGFGSTVANRLREQKDTVIAEVESGRPGTALAVVNRQEVVERVYENAVNRKAKPQAGYRINGGAYGEGKAAGERANITAQAGIGA